MTNTNVDALAVHRNSWLEQMKDALNVNGGDLENATCSDYVLHLLAFNWKVIFSLIPPPSLLGGWLCFFVSLFCVGIVTAIIGDIATIFGCTVGIKDTVTGWFSKLRVKEKLNLIEFFSNHSCGIGNITSGHFRQPYSSCQRTNCG